MWLDVAAVSCVILFAVLGAMRGLFSQAWSVGALVVAYLAADPVMAVVQGRLGPPDETFIGNWILKLLVGFAIFVLLLVVGFALEKLLVERFKVIHVSNRLLGGILGGIKGIGGAIVVIWLLLFFFPPHKQNASFVAQQVGASRLAERLHPYNPANLLVLSRVRPYLPSDVTGLSRPPATPPSSLKEDPLFQALLNDSAFLSAYQARHFVALLQNSAFQALMRSPTSLMKLEQGTR